MRRNGFEVIFSSTEFGKIQVLLIKNEPWFIGKQICDALGYENSRKAIADHVDEDDKRNTVTKRYGIPGNPNITIINEPGLYSLVMSSKLDNAKRFKRWVVSEVLPNIRKYGFYMEDDAKWDALREVAARLFTVQKEVIRNLKTKDSPEGIIRYDSSEQATEADMLNIAVFQKTAKEWREENPDKKGNMRDYATDDELLVLSITQAINTVCIWAKIPMDIRFNKLERFARGYLDLLEMHRRNRGMLLTERDILRIGGE